MTDLQTVFNQYHTTLEFTHQIMARAFHEKLIETIKDTKIETLAITIMPLLPEHVATSAPGAHSISYAIDAERHDDDTPVIATHTFTQREDGSFDLTEHGNDGMLSFLACDIEYSRWKQLMDAMLYNHEDILNFFGLDRSHQGVDQVVFARNKFWVVDTKIPVEGYDDAEAAAQ